MNEIRERTKGKAKFLSPPKSQCLDSCKVCFEQLTAGKEKVIDENIRINPPTLAGFLFEERPFSLWGFLERPAKCISKLLLHPQGFLEKKK